MTLSASNRAIDSAGLAATVGLVGDGELERHRDELTMREMIQREAR